MKRIIQTSLLLALAALSTGCSTPYMVDRRRDATDIFTATVGYGAGMKARVGPLQAGLLVDVTWVGVRSGDILGPSDYWPKGFDTPGSWDITATLFNVEASSGGKTAMQRGKAYSFITHSPLVYPQDPTPESSARRKHWLNEHKYRHAPGSFYTQIEVVVALGPSVRLGFNPGELLDFILGWFLIDLYGDDIEMKKYREQRKSNKASHPIAASRGEG